MMITAEFLLETGHLYLHEILVNSYRNRFTSKSCLDYNEWSTALAFRHLARQLVPDAVEEAEKLQAEKAEKREKRYEQQLKELREELANLQGEKRESDSVATGGLLECKMCGEVFKKKNSRHFKCPECGSHFTKSAKGKRTAHN